MTRTTFLAVVFGAACLSAVVICFSTTAGAQAPAAPDAGEANAQAEDGGAPAERPGRPALGVHLFDSPLGPTVQGVFVGGPGFQAGLVSGDVIDKLNDKVHRSVAELNRAIGELQPGDQVTLAVLRAGQPLQLTATLAAWENVFAQQPPPDRPRRFTRRFAIDPFDEIEQLRDRVEKLEDEIQSLRRELEELRQRDNVPPVGEADGEDKLPLESGAILEDAT